LDEAFTHLATGVRSVEFISMQLDGNPLTTHEREGLASIAFSVYSAQLVALDKVARIIFPDAQEVKALRA
jgi:hypothetical protein